MDNQLVQASGQTTTLTLVVPVFNEQEGLGIFYTRAKAVLAALEPEYTARILFVNDGSTDDSLAILLRLRQMDPAVQLIILSRNFGHQAAITAGLDHAESEVVVIIDADLQDPPEVIPDLLAQWRQGMKVVYGIRRRREGENAFKRWTATVFYRVLRRISDTAIPVDAGDFRLLDREVVLVMRDLREQSRYVRGLVSWVGFAQCGVAYDRSSRLAGQTKYPLGKMFALAMNGMVNFSEKPLYWVGYLGFLITLCSLAASAWILVSKFLYPETTVRGWNSLIIAIAFFGGVQLLTIGVLGQYIGRIFAEVKHRPLYVVARTIGLPPERRTDGHADQQSHAA